MERIRELDGMRGLGSLMIMSFHAWPATFFFGWTRVDMFLVLSGYLITTILLKYGFSRHFFGSFYARRALRILPVYFVGLLAVLALNQAMRNPSPTDGVFRHIFLLQNTELWFSDEAVAFPPRFAHAWTIAMEERFYLIWPLLLCLAGPRVGAGVCLGLVVLCPILRARGYSPFIMPGRADALALGCLLVFLFRSRDWSGGAGKSLRWAFAGLGVATVGLLMSIGAPEVGAGVKAEIVDAGGPLSPEVRRALTYSLSALSFFALLGLVHLNAGHAWLAPLRSPVLTWVGLMSYGIYMYHQLFFWMVDGIATRFWPDARAWLMAPAMAATLAAAWLSYRYMESPLLRLKDRFPYRPRAAVGAPGAGVEVQGAALGSGATQMPA